MYAKITHKDINDIAKELACICSSLLTKENIEQKHDIVKELTNLISFLLFKNSESVEENPNETELEELDDEEIEELGNEEIEKREIRCDRMKTLIGDNKEFVIYDLYNNEDNSHRKYLSFTHDERFKDKRDADGKIKYTICPKHMMKIKFH